MGTRITIAGDGQMGLVLADALHERGADVVIWGPCAEHVDRLSSSRHSERLPGFHLHEAVTVTTDAETVADAEYLVNAIPVQFIRSAWTGLAPHVKTGTPLICVSKGIENETLLRPTEILVSVCGQGSNPGLVALSGPTIAAELALRQPAVFIAASVDPSLSTAVQDLLHVPWLRVYTHDDVPGIELSGAAKNVIALAAGILDGLDAGDNAKSALLARGLVEIVRLGTAMGARTDTFFGIGGVGDLATTCFSPSGRNRSCGERLGRGEALEDILESMVSVVEGVATARSIRELSRRHVVDMPISDSVYAILYEGLPPMDALKELMHREPKAEIIG